MVASIRGPHPRGHGIGPINPTSLRDLRDCCLLAKIEYSISDAAEELWQKLQEAAAPDEVRLAVSAARIDQLESQVRALQAEVQALQSDERLTATSFEGQPFAVIQEVALLGPAANAGLQAGDRILYFGERHEAAWSSKDGHATTVEEMRKLMGRCSTVRVLVERNGLRVEASPRLQSKNNGPYLGLRIQPLIERTESAECGKSDRHKRRNRGAHRRRRLRTACGMEPRAPGIQPSLGPTREEPETQCAPLSMPTEEPPSGTQAKPPPAFLPPLNGQLGLFPPGLCSEPETLPSSEQSGLLPPGPPQCNVFTIPNEILYLEQQPSMNMDALVQGARQLQARIQQLSQTHASDCEPKRAPPPNSEAEHQPPSQTQPSEPSTPPASFEPKWASSKGAIQQPDNEAVNQPAQRRPSEHAPSPCEPEPAAAAPTARPPTARKALGLHYAQGPDRTRGFALERSVRWCAEQHRSQTRASEPKPPLRSEPERPTFIGAAEQQCSRTWADVVRQGREEANNSKGAPSFQRWESQKMPKRMTPRAGALVRGG